MRKTRRKALGFPLGFLLALKSRKKEQPLKVAARESGFNYHSDSAAEEGSMMDRNSSLLMVSWDKRYSETCVSLSIFVLRMSSQH